MRATKAAVFLATVSGLSCCATFGQLPAVPAQHEETTPAVTNPVDAQRFRDQIRTIENLLPKLSDRGAALFLLAHHYARLGELKKALSLVKECVALDEGFDPGDVRAFEPLRSVPEFRELAERVRRGNSPVHRASVAFAVPEKDLFPEGLAVDAEKRVFYMGSMHRKKIVMITESGAVSDFVKPDVYGLMPVGGVKVDPLDHSVWAATDPGPENRSELVHFDALGKLMERFPTPGAGTHDLHDLNDLVIRNAREIYATDTEGNQVYRFDRASHAFTALTFCRPVFEPNGITLSGDGNLLYVADDLGVIQMDLGTNAAKEVNPGQQNTLAGIDGLYWYKGALLGVEYGTGSYRVMRWKLSLDGRLVTASEILERGTDLVSDPTTGAIFEEKFYFIANTGIYNLDADKILDPTKLEPVYVAVVPLEVAPRR